MIRAFVLTAIFWSLFIIANSVTDAILFYQNFIWYGQKDLWHTIKFFWIGFAVLTGWCASELWEKARFELHYEPIIGRRKPKKFKLKAVGVFAFLVLYFLFLRWILFEELMKKWSGQ